MFSLLATHQQLRSDGADGPMVKVQGEASGLRLVGFYHEHMGKFETSQVQELDSSLEETMVTLGREFWRWPLIEDSENLRESGIKYMWSFRSLAFWRPICRTSGVAWRILNEWVSPCSDDISLRTSGLTGHPEVNAVVQRLCHQARLKLKLHVNVWISRQIS